MAKARVINSAACLTKWHVTMDNGKEYCVKTYPNSALMYIESESGRAVKLGGIAVKEICDAIANAKEQA